MTMIEEVIYVHGEAWRVTLVPVLTGTADKRFYITQEPLPHGGE